jgi:hypothetical protein
MRQHSLMKTSILVVFLLFVGSTSALAVDIDVRDDTGHFAIASKVLKWHIGSGVGSEDNTITIPYDEYWRERFHKHIDPPVGCDQVRIDILAYVKWGMFCSYRQMHNYSITIHDIPSGVLIHLGSDYRVSNPDNTRARIEVIGGRHAHPIEECTICGMNKYPHWGNDRILTALVEIWNEIKITSQYTRISFLGWTWKIYKTWYGGLYVMIKLRNRWSDDTCVEGAIVGLLSMLFIYASFRPTIPLNSPYMIGSMIIVFFVSFFATCFLLEWWKNKRGH